MLKHHLAWRVFLIFLGVILFSAITIGILAAGALKRFYRDTQINSLTNIAQLIEPQVAGSFEPAADPDASQKAVLHLGEVARQLRITLIRPDGVVIADSRENPGLMENHADRPEIIAALAGRFEPEIRHSDTLNTMMLYVAEPVMSGESIVGVIRVSRPLNAIEDAYRDITHVLWSSSLVATLLAVLLSLYIARRMSRPVEITRNMAERYAAGDFSQRLYFESPREFQALASSMNRMASQLDERIREITRQRNQQEAILTCMREGLIAIDNDERIIMINRTAEMILNISRAFAVGNLVQEVIRNAELQRFIKSAMAGQDIAEENPVIQTDEQHWIMAGSSPLLDDQRRNIGLIIVLNDITQLHRLENIRREFVANVSHELRTPITSIKGFVETLREGAMADRENADRFLDIIARQADRLDAIIEDLLALSRIERENKSIDLRDCLLAGHIEAVVRHFQFKSDEKQIRITWQCDPKLSVMANGRLLEQALSNLLDNAIKYSVGDAPIHQIQRGWPPGAHRGPPDRRGNPDRRHRRRPRHRRSRPAAPVRALLPGGLRPQPRAGRYRPGPGHRQAHPAGPRRLSHGRERARQRQHVYASLAGLGRLTYF